MLFGAIFTALLISGLPLFAARFPNSVPKTFTVTGKTALEWAKVLGLNAKERQSLQFPLHPMEAHALSLRTNSVQDEKASFNSIDFDPDTQRMALTGSWLDQTTGSADSKHPRYTFGSAFIPEDLAGSGSWGNLLRSLGFPKPTSVSKKYGEVLEKRSSDTHWFPWSEKRPWVEIKVYQLESFDEAYKADPWGYQVVIGIEE